MERCIGAIKRRCHKHNDPYAGGEKLGKNAKPDAVSPTANELARADRPAPAASATCAHAAVLTTPCMSPSAAAAGPSAHFSTHAHPSSPPPLAYPPSSTVSQSTFLRLSTALLGHAFVPPSSASSRSSGEQGIGAEILPHSLAHFIPGPSHTFIPGAPSLDLLKNKSGTIT
jgi:hypothetical protein